MPSLMKTVRSDRVRPGDLADHKSRTLDPRPVESVDRANRTVVLRIGTVLTPPLPLANYTFSRRVEEVRPA